MPTYTVVREYSNNANHIAAPRSPAEELRLALIRYERLSSPPRWMLFPLVSDINGYERSRDHAIDTGNELRARELQGWLDAEWRRRDLLAQWQGERVPYELYLHVEPRECGVNWKGRTLDAWQELLSRMWQARSNAVEAGVLDRASESYRFVSDRIRDVERRVDLARHRETRGEPSIA
jgi:hypothetical protein